MHKSGGAIFGRKAKDTDRNTIESKHDDAKDLKMKDSPSAMVYREVIWEDMSET